MAKKKFSITESEITALFKRGDTFTFEDESYQVITVGKPSPSKGECKTDTYIKALKLGGSAETKEIKISIKQGNAEFLENKINLDRAIQIFGVDAQKIISKSILKIKDYFEKDMLICFEKYKTTEAKTIKIGWKFECTFRSC